MPELLMPLALLSALDAVRLLGESWEAIWVLPAHSLTWDKSATKFP